MLGHCATRKLIETEGKAVRGRVVCERSKRTITENRGGGRLEYVKLGGQLEATTVESAISRKNNRVARRLCALQKTTGIPESSKPRCLRRVSAKNGLVRCGQTRGGKVKM